MSEVVVGLEPLAELVRTTATSGVSRRAMLLRTDRLSPSLSRAEQLRSARNAVTPLTRAERARRHDLQGGRIVMTWKGDSERLISQTMAGLTELLREHPIDAAPIDKIVDFYDLPADGATLLQAVVTDLPIEEIMPDPAPVVPTKSAPPLQPLEPAELERLELSLAGTDMSRFARRRPVCRYNGRVAQLAWEERTLTIPELIDTVAPGRDAKSDVWLFRRLTRLLDRRMLSILSDPPELRGAGPFSITLNVASVLSPEFLRFDAALPANLRSRVVISFLPADIVSDTAAFAFARNFARGRSYRVCLRAVSASLLPALDFAALDLDYFQLIWSSKLTELSALPDAGKAQWIIGQPCTAEAVAWGLSCGIDLFTMRPST